MLPERLLNIREVAATLATSTATVYRLIARGELRAIRISEALRIAPAELARFARARSD